MKKVLIITYYWPPAGGPGVQRVLKFAKYLPEFGWQPHVLTVNEGEFPAIDDSLVSDIPEDIFIHKTKSFEPFGIYKKLVGKKEKDKIPTFVLNQSKSDGLKDRLAKWVRLNIFIPDAKIGWIPFAVSDGLKILEDQKIDLVFSSSPPQTINLIARKLSKKSGIPWVADYRDPWTDAFWQEGGRARNFIPQKIDKNLEKAALSSASSISAVSKSLIDLFKNKVDNDYILIPNGFDAEDFSAQKKVKSDKFRITYIGYLGKDQRIDNFLWALRALDKKVINKLDIQFYGNIHPVIVSKINDLSLNNLIQIKNYIPHTEAIKIMQNSEMLLLVIPDVANNELIVTGKLFEYLATKNFILGIGPQKSDVVEILQSTNGGLMVDYQEDLSKILLSQIQKWEKGESQETKSAVINNYTRKALTEKLAAKFNQVLNQ